MGISERKARQKQELQDKIFFSAIELVQQEGVEGFSIRKLAEMIEYSTRTIYLHFESKYDLFNKIIDRAYEATVKKYQVIDKMKNGSNSTDLVRAKIELHIETALENPVFYQSVIKIIQSNEFVMGENQRKVIQSITDDVSDLLKDKYDTKEIMIRTQLAIAFLQSATMLLITNNKMLEEQGSYIQTTLDSIFKGILS